LVLRILFGLALVALAIWGLRRALANRPQLAPPRTGSEPISASELRAMERIAAPLMEEALSLRPKILEVAQDARISETAETLIRELARELQNEARIGEALAEIDDAKLGEQLTVADDRLREAREDPEARHLAEGTIERLIAVRDARDKLRRRRDEIQTRGKHMVLELRAAHLALLDASAGGAAERVEEVRARLRIACDEARRAAVAEEEVAKLIARGVASSTSE
jgi:hypothetical protein